MTLDVSRTYSSNDWAYFGGPAGSFGRGWHHDWEAWLSCTGTKCTVARGLTRALTFMYQGTAPSLDGTETWQVFVTWSNQVLADDHHDILVRRPGGEWIAFLSNGSELHFGVVCDACGSGENDPFCQDAAAGGKARLVEVVNPNGNRVHLAYDRPHGVLLSLADDLGHVMELRGQAACSDGLATELRYDGLVMATYAYSGADLVQATDADGRILRAYAYDTYGTQRLLAVTNESGGNVSSFAYDEQARAVGVIDRNSSVAVDYDLPSGIQVTEYFGSGYSTSTRTLDRDGHVTSISDGCACGSAHAYKWLNRRLVCSQDSLNHVTWSDYDSLGRFVHSVEFSSTSGCPSRAPTNLSAASSREEWRGHAVTKPIAQGVALALDMVTTVQRKSAVNSSKVAAEDYSYDPTPQATDPSGYSCQASPLPVGSVICRRILSGYAYNISGTAIATRYATFYSYDSRARLVRTMGPLDLDHPSSTDVTPVEERVYWSDGDALPRRGRLREVRRYLSPTSSPLVTSYDYDALGTFQVTQPSGAVTTFVKDGRGRTTVVIGADGQAVQTRYYDGLDARLQVLASGAVVRLNHDGNGRLSGMEYLSGDPEATGTTAVLGWGEYYAYDAAGNRTHTERRDEAGIVGWRQDRQYDVQHRVVSDTNPNAPTTARLTSYDASGFLAGVVDEEGRSVSFTPDALNRVAKIHRAGFDAGGSPVGLDVATYTYSTSSSSPGSVKDGKGLSTSYSYDDFGRLASLSTPNNTYNAPLRFTYDPRGNVVQRTFSKVTESYTYDGADRLLTRSALNSKDGASVNYAYRYDESGYTGLLTSVVESDRTVTFTYDATGRLVTESMLEGGVSTPLVTRYGYDADGNLSDLTYPSGLHVALARDPATRQVAQVYDADGSVVYADQVRWMPGGPVRSFAFGNGLSLSQTFDLRYEPTTLASGPVALGIGMSPAGDLASLTEAGVSRAFRHDFLDRLDSSPDWLSYGYDNNGNRTSEMVEGVAAAYTYSNDLVTQKRDQAGLATFAFGYDYQSNVSAIGQYDAAGTAVTATYCLRHDPLGRIVTIGPRTGSWSGPGTLVCLNDAEVPTPAARFKYDAQGRRVARWLAATNQWTYVLSDGGGHPLSEFVKGLDPTPWVKVRDYVWLGDTPLAQIEYPGPGGGSQGYVYYFHVDHIGLPRALTNVAGATVWSASMRPYGDIAEAQGVDPLSGRTVVTNLRLPGQYDERLLGSVGLQGPYYNWNRWYLPGVGRYLEPDPIALAGGFNGEFGPDWYGYANQNPLSNFDPYGLEVFVNWDFGSDQYGSLPPGWAGETFIKNNGGRVTRCTCKCGDSDCKFDATVNLSLWRKFLNEEAKSKESCDSRGLTIAQHEDLHVADFKKDLGAPALNGAYKTENFSSRAECERAQAGFARWLQGYFNGVVSNTKRHDTCPH